MIQSASSTFKRWALAVACTAALSGPGHAFELVPGHVYTSDSSTNAIIQVQPDGVEVDTLTLPGYTDGTKGLAFGPDGTLFVVAVADHGFDVVRIGPQGQVLATYAGPTYVFGNLSYGKIAVSDSGRVYVTGQDSLLTFQPGVTGVSTIYTDNQVYDVEILPSGNLLVLTAYRIVELTPSGGFVRTVVPSHGVVDGRGLEYDPVTNSVFATMLGYSEHYFQVMRFDASTGILEGSNAYTYADDLFLTIDRRLLVGSRTQPPAWFGLDTAMLGVLNPRQRMFVTVYSVEAVFSDDFED